MNERNEHCSFDRIQEGEANVAIVMNVYNRSSLKT